MLLIGSHVGYSSKTGLLGSVEEALSYDETCFMFYTGAPQNTTRSKIDKTTVDDALRLMKDNNIDKDKVIVHAPYIINLANTEKYDFAVSFLKQEIERVKDLNMKYLVLHPGSHVNLGVEVGINNIAKGLNEVLNKDVMILLETMAGKGTEVGRSLEEIKKIIDNVESYKQKFLGICLDTCHLNDAGYDMSKFDEFLEEFDRKIGIDNIKCVHINDSKNVSNSHKDRHANIGYGTIGFDNLIKIIYHDKLKDIPKILETPYIEKKAPYKYEIEMIRNKTFNENLEEEVKNVNQK